MAVGIYALVSRQREQVIADHCNQLDNDLCAAVHSRGRTLRLVQRHLALQKEESCPGPGAGHGGQRMTLPIGAVQRAWQVSAPGLLDDVHNPP